MRRLTISLPDDLIDEVVERAEAKKHKSISYYISKLIELAIKVEKMSEEKAADDQEDPIIARLDFMQKLLERTVSASHDSLYLNRYQIQHLSHQSIEENEHIITQARVHAKTLVETLIEEYSPTRADQTKPETGLKKAKEEAKISEKEDNKSRNILSDLPKMKAQNSPTSSVE